MHARTHTHTQNSVPVVAAAGPAADNSQCRLCEERWFRLRSESTYKKCRQTCRIQNKRGFYVLDDPPCKRDCCRQLCAAETGWKMRKACKKLGYCVRTGAPSAVPSDAPTTTTPVASAGPTAVVGTTGPTTACEAEEPTPACQRGLGCYDCISRGCYFRMGGGAGGCSDCLPLRAECSTTSGAYCHGLPQRVEGRDACLARIDADCCSA